MVNSSKSQLTDGPSHSRAEHRLVQYEYLGFPWEARPCYVFSVTVRCEFLQIPLCQKRAQEGGRWCLPWPVAEGNSEVLGRSEGHDMPLRL